MTTPKKRSAASYKAAAHKAQLTRKRNLRAGSKSPAKRSTTTKRRRPAKKKGFLSAMTGAESRNAFRSLASGTIGGGLYLIYEDQVALPDSTPEKKAAVAALGAYVLATMGKRPNVAAGIIGAAAYDFFKTKGLLSDSSDTQMQRMNYADPLQNIPIQLSDDAMNLAQAGEMNLAEAMEMDLADGGDWYQPPYAETYTY